MNDEISYEIFVRSFADSNGDGIGDLNGIRGQLPYLQDLGITRIWLTPIFQSPSYHKYDVADYYRIDPEYGTLNDFKSLVEEAKKQGIKIILDLVLNHTSSRHPWFLEAAKNADSGLRDFYYWMTPLEIKARGIAQRKATDDSGIKYPWHWSEYEPNKKYYGMFWKEMPDLNLHSRRLFEELLEIAKYWLSFGIEGFRLDAAKHIFPSWEPLEKSVQFWKNFAIALRKHKQDLYLIGEVWDAPHVVAPFFSAFDANFNIDFAFALQKTLMKGKDEEGLIERLFRAHKLYSIYRPDFIDGTILSNHDQTRIGSLLNGELDKLKMAANILLTLPGQAYIYYGEEIGMLGEKPDEHIRECFPLHSKSQTHWFKGKYKLPKSPQEQKSEAHSLLNHYQKMIALRKRIPALHLSSAKLQLSDIRNPYVLSFIRGEEHEHLLIIQNISAKAQTIDLSTKHETFEKVLHADRNAILKDRRAIIPAYSLLILSNAK
ncbi:alpha-amylase [Marinilongibacter aquaticus]|uniref:alpha-amylase family glycosyl hydrolase n=1 Tax=Marinilongibacter aquaticus TaxID=2975157 RepID=UPI0021BD21EF|nr:alpha-amylase family glycosyl hydrolase [Marinilongibacter aquaticus]UBM57793.1 alpha-amylase [Marinilongibacter aquaticus]